MVFDFTIVGLFFWGTRSFIGIPTEKHSLLRNFHYTPFSDAIRFADERIATQQ